MNKNVNRSPPSSDLGFDYGLTKQLVPEINCTFANHFGPNGSVFHYNVLSSKDKVQNIARERVWKPLGLTCLNSTVCSKSGFSNSSIVTLNVFPHKRVCFLQVYEI